TTYKLGQKVRADPARPSLVHLTNLYLTRAEFELIRQLDGAAVSKTRWRWTVGAHTFAVDQFDGPLRGLVLAEVELASDPPATPPPPAPRHARVRPRRGGRGGRGGGARGGRGGGGPPAGAPPPAPPPPP